MFYQRFISLLLILCFSLNTLANDETLISNYPGGVITLKIEKKSNDLPEVKYGLKEPAILDNKNNWLVVIGIGLDTLLGEYVVYLKHGIKGLPGEHRKINVKHANYPFTEVKQKDTHHYLLNSTAYESFSDIDFDNTQQPTFPLRLPIDAKWHDSFGHKLQLPSSSKLITPNYVSILAPALTPVRSPQNAIVSKIDTLDNGLYRVFLDHGRGVYSIISGLSDLTVEVSNGIVEGAVIGKLPSNKATEPKDKDASASNKQRSLFWQTVVNGEFVNPLILNKLQI